MADALYSGARGRIDLAAIGKLGPSWVVQPKIDGVFARLVTDARGRLVASAMRSGAPLPCDVHHELAAGRLWPRSAILVAEVEAFTEASQRARAARGHALAHVFDVQRIDGADVTREPYRVRRDHVCRAEAELELARTDRDRRGRYQVRPLRWTVILQKPPHMVDAAMAEWVAPGGEGLVAVALGARLGAKGAKRKFKPVSTLDVVVVEVGDRAIVTWWQAAQKRIVVSRPASLVVTVGDMLELVHESYYDDGTPKFARVSRTRPDLVSVTATR